MLIPGRLVQGMDDDSLDASGHILRFVPSSQVMVTEQNNEAGPDVRVVKTVHSARKKNLLGQKDVFYSFVHNQMDA